MNDVVKGNVRREPRVVAMLQRQTVGLVRNDAAMNHLTAAVDAAAESAAKQTDAHDAEEQPEDEADEQHVEDGWNSVDQRVHDHLTISEYLCTFSCGQVLWLRSRDRKKRIGHDKWL